jgi:hypothetical protein
MRYLLTILTLGVIFAACQKKEVLPGSYTTEVGIYHVSGTAGNDSFYFHGGAGSFEADIQVDDTTGIRVWRSSVHRANQLDTPILSLAIMNNRFPLGNMSHDFDSTVRNNSYTYNLFFAPSLLQLESVIIAYENEAGNRYYSGFMDNVAYNSYFTLSKVTDVYHQGKRYKKATVSFSCLMRDQANTDTMNFVGSGQVLFGGI